MTPAAKQRLLQLWTALLCLAASFAYLLREPDHLSGSLSLPAVAGMATDMGNMDMSGELADMEMDRADHSAHAPSSAPNKSAHSHARHCPFCFSAAFALETQGVELWVDTAKHADFSSFPYHTPHLLTLRHAEARAPPPFQS
ncbi:DUF2946 domain-containing protein [Deinococcus psychrotolerans]|uniref:DUF2946 domain-containing protein n=1 Tax=Deinococcus psychrotolerans TaxID=2489213 RepID=A0A3G8YN91_9DEIO|nr:DUF2946 family protein [Deinococcus psychrotolerans]AZI42606.1 DUF2946 domain-containing protein [Deinococcus psychrotolerans]